MRRPTAFPRAHLALCAAAARQRQRHPIRECGGHMGASEPPCPPAWYSRKAAMRSDPSTMEHAHAMRCAGRVTSLCVVSVKSSATVQAVRVLTNCAPYLRAGANECGMGSAPRRKTAKMVKRVYCYSQFA